VIAPLANQACDDRKNDGLLFLKSGWHLFDEWKSAQILGSEQFAAGAIQYSSGDVRRVNRIRDGLIRAHLDLAALGIAYALRAVSGSAMYGVPARIECRHSVSMPENMVPDSPSSRIGIVEP
jgi:hypothetical protein